MNKRVNILVDFGGPRSIPEIVSFLTELLCDQDVVRTNLPPLFHRLLFRQVAKKRAKKISHDYDKIGGRSPIYENTELLRAELQKELEGDLLAFHRYLPQTHPQFLEQIVKYDEIRLVPMFPQFTYATTGSCAKFFANRLPQEVVRKMRWVKSYPTNGSFIQAWVDLIRPYVDERSFLLFTFHGVPEKFIYSGDLYLDECIASYKAVMDFFPGHSSAYAFQSQFGPDVWLKPSTQEMCEKIEKWADPDQKIVIVPLSFTSDHIETLFEIEETYMPILRANHYETARVPALNLHPTWIEALKGLFHSKEWTNNHMLIRPLGCKTRCVSCKRRCKR